jgi:hypothetical protein
MPKMYRTRACELPFTWISPPRISIPLNSVSLLFATQLLPSRRDSWCILRHLPLERRQRCASFIALGSACRKLGAGLIALSGSSGR